MRLLVLGGTLFLGRAAVEIALARGYEVTTFTRGRTKPDLFPEAEHLHGDRDGDLAALEGRTWDAVVDTCGYVPRVVRASAELLHGSTDQYVFISSISAYADRSPIALDEDHAVQTLDDPSTEDVQAHYGGLKALCEAVVREVYGERALVVRPGLIVGPHDPTGRFTYWPVRVARGGEVLAPGDPGRRVQVIDVRDLAEWLVDMVEAGAGGIYNATGPEYPLTMGRMLEACKAAARSDAAFVWVPDEFLLEHEVAQFMEMPLWLAVPEEAGTLSVDVSRALDAGLSFRPLEETARDTLEWATGPDFEQLPKAGQQIGKAGMAPEREAELLEAWRAHA